MNQFYLNKGNKAAMFFAMALLPSGLAFSQTKKDTVPKEKKIEEVVMIGYGTQKKEAVTGSVSSLSGNAIKEVPSANITDAIQGRLPGVDIGRTSTKPGAVQQIRIRGERSLTGSNDPLIVLDGIPFVGSLGDISPSDIKTLDVLKDASATAIYGSRGANGVIIITTNRGGKGQRAKFSYNGYTGFQTIFSKYPVMSGDKFAKLRADANLFTNGPDEINGINTDWQDQYYGVGLMMNHDVAVTGGTEKGGYNFGVAYFQQNGVVPLQSYKRLSIRGALDQEINSWLKVGFSTNSNFSINDFNGISGAPVLGYSPLTSPYLPDGSPRLRTTFANQDQTALQTRSILESLGDAYADRTNAFSSYNNLYAEIKIPSVEGLKYRLNVGLTYRNSNSGYYLGTGALNYQPTTASSASIGNSLTNQWVIENLITYDKNFGKHKINATALYSAEQTRFNSSSIAARDVPLDAFQYFNLGHAQGEITIDPNNQGYWRRGLMSFMGRAMYQYDNRYMLTATVRSDGASVLAKGHQWHTYPAVSVGWNVANESFLQGSKYINVLKLRAGFGETSNQAVAPYTTFGSLSTTPYNFGTANAIGNYVNRAPNASLGWEFSKTWNYGVDFSIFNKRISGTVEYYVTNTEKLLLDKQLPPSSGLNLVLQNVGASQNKGLEVSLNALIFDNPQGFSWEVGGNLAANRNKITALASGQDRNVNNLWFVGYNINAIYDYQYVGLWQQGDPYLNILEPQTGAAPGMIKVLYTGGYNADGTPVRAINEADRQIINTNPDFIGGFNTRLAYKNIDLSVVGAFQKGGVLISTIYGSAGYLNRLTGRGNNVDVDYWSPENTDVRYPKPGGLLSGDNPKYASTLALFDASFVKIRTITLGYNFDKSTLENLGVSNLRLYVTVQNPFVFGSPYYRHSGMDPEPNSRGNENQAVNSYKANQLVIGTNNPATRNYLLGLNLTF
ncbi:collagen-binding protein [Chryseobacterium formosense]|uniref:Collagen-binding protein n=1 Tax=Chryseobacterium formosense TaxID=236814 RepID=A0A085Z5S3_9FLAO|nr:SusC/RagA family TonB-linked outer membrane protein [Chryseobacterium formosense]KFE99786.1 collagen-binding protein [Chryseobacterium formosense]SFT69886.1 TonB-linked outer membrane protein, SusC/RagA family [Chryseobacterium formosense]